MAKKVLDLGPDSKAYLFSVGMLNGLTIGKVARLCGVSRDTLRFYEREGLLPPSRRSASGYRLYTEADADRVRFIRRAQATGLTLDDIRDLLRVHQLRTPEACRRVASRLRSRVEAMDRKVSELRAFRAELAGALERCEQGLSESCPVVLDFSGGVLKEERAG